MSHKRDVDCGNRRHRHRPASPVRAAIEELPGVLDPSGVATDQVGNDVLLQVRGDGELAAIERRIAEPDDACARLDPERDEIAPRTGDDHARVHDLAIADRAFWSHGCTSIWNGPAGSRRSVEQRADRTVGPAIAHARRSGGLRPRRARTRLPSIRARA